MGWTMVAIFSLLAVTEKRFGGGIAILSKDNKSKGHCLIVNCSC